MQWARWMNALRQAAWKQFAAACLKTSTGSRMPRKQWYAPDSVDT
jgi:hypothetical protein